ncbi:hypothetical protein [uncultured Cohaesibacter sp.]|uniref:DUF4376 domain-containing protein n=1 Tax=uncultured Cohaesibacter sp. TaxID=1002546 RepID=UPI0029C80124|nr:hypothetical protein [uncultured Cohaesibacter sp.]
MSLIIYNYHPQTREFLSASWADISPLEKDVYLIPSFATETAPPEAQEGYARVFEDGAWVAVIDHRDEVWWLNGAQVVIDFLGEPSAEDGWTQEGPPEAGDGESVQWSDNGWEILADHRGETWFDGEGNSVRIDFLGDPSERDLKATPVEPESEEPGPLTGDDVNLERLKRIEDGCNVSVTGVVDPIPLQGRVQDQTNLLGLATGAQLRIASGDTTTTITFRDADNVDHDLTPPQVLELWQGGANFISAVMQASWDLKAATPIPSDYTDNAYWPTP